jgi:inosine/xanthosine triphosphate pyrophosphatase family protein
MVIQTGSYNDFKAIVASLTSPTMYAATQSYRWQAAAVSDDIAVVVNTYDGEPGAFSTDFPTVIALEELAVFT